MILPVHYAGRPADMDAFVAVARAAGLRIVEDAAHCVEGAIDGKRVGSIGDFTCFSFYATKTLRTGEGGMVTTADEQAASFMRTASLHGMSRDGWTRYAPGGSPHFLLDETAAGISRDTFHARLRARGISTSIHFRAVHLHPYYQERFGFRRGMFPVAESVSDTTLSLPLSAAMTETAVDRVIEACHDVLR